MEIDNSHNIKQLRHRFVADSGAMIQVLSDPYFSESLELFEKDFGYKTKYEFYKGEVEKSYGENYDKFLEDYHSLRDSIISKVSSSEAFKEFQTDDKITKEIKEFNPVAPLRNLFTQEQIKDGSNYFLSIDMKKANFQTLRWVNPSIVNGANSYEEFISKFTDFVPAIESKRTREIIFGKLNPNRTMKYEKILMGIVEGYLRKTNIYEWFDLFSFNGDELIYKLKNGLDFNAAIKATNNLINEESLFLNTNIVLRVEFFKLVGHHFKTYGSSKTIDIYVKEKTDGTKEYKCVSIVYFKQIYKLLNGLEINENDLTFYYDKSELAKFLHRLEIID